jgi:hypothetical protein
MLSPDNLFGVSWWGHFFEGLGGPRSLHNTPTSSWRRHHASQNSFSEVCASMCVFMSFIVYSQFDMSWKSELCLRQDGRKLGFGRFPLMFELCITNETHKLYSLLDTMYTYICRFRPPGKHRHLRPPNPLHVGRSMLLPAL